MDELRKNLKKKLSVDTLVAVMKESKVIDNNNIKEEDVRRTIEKVGPNNLVDVDELANKLNEVAKEAAKDKAGGVSQTKLRSFSAEIRDDVSFLD